MIIDNIKMFLNELAKENAIEVISINTKNNIYHFFSNNIYYSLVKVDNIWELLNFKTLNVEKIYNSNFDVIYNL